MKELVEVIAKALVDNPEEVVDESLKGDDTLIELKVAHRYGQGHWQARQDRKSNPFRSQGRCL